MNRQIKRYAFSGGVTTLLLGIGVVVALSQVETSVWDTQQLPETKGTVRQYTLTPRGDIDGLILNDGTEVKSPPHLSAQLAFAIKPGDSVTVHGLKARALPLVDAASITNDATGVSIVDNGPPGPGPERHAAPTTVSGTVRMPLHGKRGEVNGALLEDGTVLHLPPPEAARLADRLARGQTVAARGVKLTTPLGSVMDVRSFGASPEQLTEIAPPPPPHHRHGPGDRPDAPPPPPPPAP